MTLLHGHTAIVGAGNVGRALAQRMMMAGRTVRFGVRTPDETVGGDASLAPSHSVPDAIRGAAMVFLAVPANAALEALRSAESLDGVIVVDCTNPVQWNTGPLLVPPAEGSVAASIAAAFPTARVCKAFNHFGAEIHANPALRGGPADAYVAGDDAEAKDHVIALANTMGFAGRDAGPLRNAALLESLAVLWIHRATVSGRGRSWAFREEDQ
jgi:predicted dinucleotide-binding enzyme